MDTFLLLALFGIVVWLFLLLRSWVKNTGKAGKSRFNPPKTLGPAAGVYSIQGQRPHMEDTYMGTVNLNENEKHAFYSVFDGHGGHRASEYAAMNLHELLLSYDFEHAPIQALKDAFRLLDHGWLIEASRSNYDDGSTAISCLIVNNVLYVANVGDSRAVLGCGGKAIEMSRDHKPNRADEKKRIENLGGRIIYYGTWRVEGVLAVTRAIGDRRLKKYISAVPEIAERKLQEDDQYLILASDGLWDVMSSQDAVDVVKSCSDVHSAAMKLTNLAFYRGSMDNITSMVIDLAPFRS